MKKYSTDQIQYDLSDEEFDRFCDVASAFVEAVIDDLGEHPEQIHATAVAIMETGEVIWVDFIATDEPEESQYDIFLNEVFVFESEAEAAAYEETTVPEHMQSHGFSLN